MIQFDWHDSGIVPGHAFSFDLDLFMSLIPRKTPFNYVYFFLSCQFSHKKTAPPIV